MNKLKPCPFCGTQVEIHGGLEEWKPTFYDPDSGGDPLYVSCKCGLEFSTGTYDYDEFAEAWNRRVEDNG